MSSAGAKGDHQSAHKQESRPDASHRDPSVTKGQQVNNRSHLKVLQPSDLNESQIKRLEKLTGNFKLRTSAELKPHFVVCSPGRVNLIGDHIDYHGFSVLPMAIENSNWLCCSASQFIRHEAQKPTGKIHLMNIKPVEYQDWSGSHSFRYGSELSLSHKWHNYFLCGYHGALSRKLLYVKPSEVLGHAKKLATSEAELEKADSKLTQFGDLRVLVDSDLPVESGLSSSSSLVCGSTLVSCLLAELSLSNGSSETHIHEPDNQRNAKISNKFWNLSKAAANLETQEIAGYCSKFEHLVGTQGGGMDQAVIMTAQEGFAKYVEFVPNLRCENVRLPEGIVWLVSHCGVSYPKAATTGYNTRVLETRLGAALIVKRLSTECHLAGATIELDRSITLGSVRSQFFDDSLPVAEVVKQIRERVFENKSTFKVDEICDALGMTRQQMIDRFDTSEKFLSNNLTDGIFHLLDRCEHVLEEADRVERFKSICDTTTDIVLLGQLMTQSHQSLRDKYDCSHPALDRLVGVALEAGALGSRLTGAGWGGCIVSLVETSKADFVSERLREVSKFTFRTEPQAGCYLIDLTGLG